MLRRRHSAARIAAVAAAIAIAIALPAAAEETTLVLQDGQELVGLDLERAEDGSYVLTLGTGAKLSIPALLVVEVRLSAAAPEDDAFRSGIVATDARELSGSGGRASTPSIEERLGALGDPEGRRDQSGPVDPTWRPESDWSEETDVSGFNPSRWFRSSMKPKWEPTPAYDAEADVLAPRRYRWRPNLIDNRWGPSDGFAARDRFFEEPERAPRTYEPDVSFTEQ